jgi:hypothetical protein
MSQQDAGNGDERTVPLTLTRYGIDRIMHFAHFIPVKKGLHQKHIDDKSPGWTWNQMVHLLSDTGVLIDRAGGSRCHWKLESLHVNKRLETTVNGTKTLSKTTSGSTTPAKTPTSTNPHWATS